MLSVHALSCIRGGWPLFEGLDFALRPREWAHVQGGNGAGKTSLLRLLAGLSRPHGGEVRWRGQAIGGEAWRRELLYLGHASAVKEELSPLENLRMASAVDGDALDDAQAARALGRFGLAGSEDLPVRFLSAGQKRRVLLARTLTRRATAWILDEPFTALDTDAVGLLAGVVREHLDSGGVAVVTSHQGIPLAGGQVVQL